MNLPTITSNFTNSAINQDMALRLAALNWQVEAELDRQRTIQKARDYLEGDQIIFLTPRLREFLMLDDLEDVEDDEIGFNLNFIGVIVRAVTERMEIIGFTSNEASVETTQTDDTGQSKTIQVKPFANWCWETWIQYGLDAKSSEIHDDAVNEGEHFLFVDIDQEQRQLIFTPHQRYVDVKAGGDSQGCKAFYSTPDDPTTRLLYIEKRWLEWDSNATQQIAFANRYFPNRIEHFMNKGGEWEPRIVPQEQALTGEGEPSAIESQTVGNVTWRTEDKTPNGVPLGIPIFHFCNRKMRPEAKDAFAEQDLANKTLVDLAGAADATGFRYHIIVGASMKDKEGNDVNVTAGSFVALPKKEANAVAIHTVDPADLSGLINWLDKIAGYAAIITDTPVSRFQFTGQVASDQTQKQYDAPLIKKVKHRDGIFGPVWARVMQYAAKLEKLYGATNPPAFEGIALRPTWINPEPRAEAEVATTVGVKISQCDISIQQGWRELGYSEQQITQMMEEKAAWTKMMTQASMIDTVPPTDPNGNGGNL